MCSVCVCAHVKLTLSLCYTALFQLREEAQKEFKQVLSDNAAEPELLDVGLQGQSSQYIHPFKTEHSVSTIPHQRRSFTVLQLLHMLLFMGILRISSNNKTQCLISLL